MRPVILALVFVSCLGLSASLNRPPVAVSTPTGLDNVWLLEIYDAGTGSAFPVACEPEGALWRITFLTAGHCILTDAELAMVDQTFGYEVHHADGRALTAGTAVARHPLRDAGLISFLSMDPVDVRRLSFELPAFGDVLLAAGYPMGLGPFLTEGRATGNVADGASLTTSDVYPGSSGGPVSLEDGTVVGIAVGGYGEMFQFVTFMAVMLPLSEVGPWLEVALRG